MLLLLQVGLFLSNIMYAVIAGSDRFVARSPLSFRGKNGPYSVPQTLVVRTLEVPVPAPPTRKFLQILLHEPRTTF